MKQKEQTPACPARMGKVGGQAVIEGVMMKSGDKTATACRLENGNITVTRSTFVSLRKKHKVCNIPLLRGVINFVEMLALSFRTLSSSAEAFVETEEEQKESKFDAWLKKHLGFSLYDATMVLSLLLGVALSLFLFIYLPRLVSDLVLPRRADGVWRAVVEGVSKVLIFIGYLSLTLLMKEMRRVFAYHGAEHKSVACYEAGDPLTPEYAKKHTRFHPRCGTSFMFVMILLGILVSALLHGFFPALAARRLLYVAVKLLILPLVVGVGFEFIMFAGKHDNFLVRALSAPGLWMQRLTTREPDEQMLEVALTALMCAMPDEFPDFDEHTYDRGQRPAPAEETAMELAEATDTDPEEPSSEETDEAPAEEATAEEAAEAPAEEATAEEATEAPAEEATAEEAAEPSADREAL